MARISRKRNAEKTTKCSTTGHSDIVERNLEAFKRFSFPETENFDPDNPMSTIGKTAIQTIPCRDRGIFAGFGLLKIPKNTIILFS